jgi:hypothetical protein
MHVVRKDGMCQHIEPKDQRPKTEDRRPKTEA